jgi:hypothetical protein
MFLCIERARRHDPLLFANRRVTTCTLLLDVSINREYDAWRFAGMRDNLIMPLRVLEVVTLMR